MPLTNEGYLDRKQRWDLAVQSAKADAPEGFEFLGFLWGEEFVHGPFLATEDNPGSIGRAVYVKAINGKED